MSRIQIRKIALCLWIWVLAGTGYAAPNSKSGKLTLEKRGKITGLQLDESDMQFTQRSTERGRQEFVLIKARYIRNQWRIVVNGKKIVATKDGSFSLDIKVDYKDGLLKVLALGPNSEVEELQLVIRKNSAQPQDLKSKKNPNSFEASLGLDTIPQFNYLTPRFELNYSLRLNEAVAYRMSNTLGALKYRSIGSGLGFQPPTYFSTDHTFSYRLGKTFRLGAGAIIRADQVKDEYLYNVLPKLSLSVRLWN